jgi:Ala-tRNA(Pro) deacylase
MTIETFFAIKEILDSSKCQYTHLTHDYVKTSEDAASIRGTNIDDAAKAIILKAESVDSVPYFIQAVIPANQRIDLKKLKIILGCKNVALASPSEVFEKTGCTVGSVPPFAKALFKIPTYLEESILSKEFIVFSAGTHHDSIMMLVRDYYRVLEPVVAQFRKDV